MLPQGFSRRGGCADAIRTGFSGYVALLLADSALHLLEGQLTPSPDRS
jgi:hypothetical protein